MMDYNPPNMFQSELPSTRLRMTLIAIIIATIPCYCVGFIFLSFAPDKNGTPTPTITDGHWNSHTAFPDDQRHPAGGDEHHHQHPDANSNPHANSHAHRFVNSLPAEHKHADIYSHVNHYPNLHAHLYIYSHIHAHVYFHKHIHSDLHNDSHNHADVHDHADADHHAIRFADCLWRRLTIRRPPANGVSFFRKHERHSSLF